MPHLASEAQFRWGKWCGSMGQHSPRGGKINILNEKINFLCSTNFKFLRQIKENSINNCEFLNFIIIFSGSPCYCLPKASENLAMPGPVILYCSEHIHFAYTSILENIHFFFNNTVF
jgi:hypothetical protein